MLDWDLVRYFVALRRAGSMGTAARQLGVDQTTVGRRIGALEERLGVQLFRRTRAGYVATAAADEIMDRALAAEAAIDAVTRQLTGKDARLEGKVRVTVVDTMMPVVVTALAELRMAHPRVEVELVVTNARLDLTRGQADVAVRMRRPREPRVLARRVGVFRVGLYASSTYTKRRPPVRPGQLEGHDTLLFSDEIALSQDPWVRQTLKGGNPVLRANSMLSLVSATAANLGVAILPCHLADPEPRLHRLGPTHQAGEAWLAMHRDLRENARARAVFDHIGKTISTLLQ